MRHAFKSLCEEAGIRAPSKVNIAAPFCGFFCTDKLKITQQWIMTYEWPIRFQLESLVRSGLTHTEDLAAVCEPVSTLIRTDGIDFAADFMRRFTEKLRLKSNGETVVECFRTALGEEWRDVHASIFDPDDSLRTRGFGAMRPCHHYPSPCP